MCVLLKFILRGCRKITAKCMIYDRNYKCFIHILCINRILHQFLKTAENFSYGIQT